MKETINLSDFGAMNKLKESLVGKEPIRENHEITPEMLRGSISKKLLKYFFEKYPDVLKRYLKKNPDKEQFVNDLKQRLHSQEADLAGFNPLYLDNLYVKFIKEVPLVESGNEKLYGRTAKEIGITDPKDVELVVSILGKYRNSALDESLKRSRENKN